MIGVPGAMKHRFATLAMVALLGFMNYPATAGAFMLRLRSAAIARGQASATSQLENTRKNPQDGLVYVWIAPGSFFMGCSAGDNECFAEETPQHRVTLTQGFWIGQTEVTVAAYERFAGFTNPPPTDSAQSMLDMPIADVTWQEAHDYCKWAGGRLPTEAEWEYAARGATAQSRYGNLDVIAWYEKNSRGSSHPVSGRRGNSFQLFDMLGNVWEWVNDWYDGTYYSHSPEVDPTGPGSGTMRVLRGGSWLNPEKLVRLSDRGRSDPDARFNYFGLRCIWTR